MLEYQYRNLAGRGFVPAAIDYPEAVLSKTAFQSQRSNLPRHWIRTTRMWVLGYLTRLEPHFNAFARKPPGLGARRRGAREAREARGVSPSFRRCNGPSSTEWLSAICVLVRLVRCHDP